MESKKSLFTAESLLLGSLVVVALLVTGVAMTPSLRESVRDFFNPEQRTILAKISGDLTGQGLHVTILKIQTRDNIVLEVYNIENPEESAMMARIVLPEKRDAYFQLKGNATNLGLADVDHDGTLEIVAPTFDEQMIARLNIYKFNPDTRGFDRMNAPANSEF
ncbi:hypothetical protein [Bdellovibrio sp. HCB337]|uniref:hypothetical protein n=1 Tax=Bdellovibrio sp. HCB337 TaxID=3394358 RepID=UPI0039A47D26